MENNILTTVKSIMDSFNVPETIWKPIMQVESGGNPSSSLVNENEASYGLFQLNQKGGLGSGYTVAQLENPEINARIAGAKMSPLVQSGKSQGLDGWKLLQYVAYNGGWPTQRGISALDYDPVVKSYDVKLGQAYDNFRNTGLQNQNPILNLSWWNPATMNKDELVRFATIGAVALMLVSLISPPKES